MSDITAYQPQMNIHTWDSGTVAACRDQSGVRPAERAGGELNKCCTQYISLDFRIAYQSVPCPQLRRIAGRQIDEPLYWTRQTLDQRPHGLRHVGKVRTRDCAVRFRNLLLYNVFLEDVNGLGYTPPFNQAPGPSP